jgi:hypothetical protein
VKTFVGILLFVALTVEREDFAYGRWNTVMVQVRPLFAGNPINAWDLCFALVALVLLFRPGALRGRARPLTRALLASLAVLGVAVLWGALHGGDVRMAYFQLASLLRAFFLVPILFGVYRTTRDLWLLAGVVLAAALYRALACVLCFHLFVLKSGISPWPQYITDHHDSTLWVVTVLGLLCCLLLNFSAWTALAVGLVTPLLVIAIHYNDRRIAWLELAGGLAMAYLITPRARLRRLNRWAVVSAPVLALYVGVGWTSQGALFTPVRQIRSAISDDPADTSNQARDLENAGLVLTLQGNRLLGKGFGQPFEEMSMVYSWGMQSRFSNYRYVPHNSVLGLAAFTGLLGFPIVWLFPSVGAFLAARARVFALQPREQILSTVAFCFPLVYGLQAFGDMGLQSPTANLLLACSLAMATRLALLTGGWPSRQPRCVPGLRLERAPSWGSSRSPALGAGWALNPDRT